MGRRSIIHLRLKDPGGDGEDAYFGSLAAIYDVYAEDDIGITLGALANTFARRGGRYENGKCVIQKGVVIRKRKNN